VTSCVDSIGFKVEGHKYMDFNAIWALFSFLYNKAKSKAQSWPFSLISFCTVSYSTIFQLLI
jgi:hypothetical protein